MKYYTITVNGNTYQVSVEENTSAPQATPVRPVPVAPAPAAPAPAPKAEATPAPAPAPSPAASSAEGSLKVNSPMPGKIISVKVNPGQAVKKGDVLLILEAMKMENEIVAPSDGTVASINVTPGQSIQAGDLLATLN